MSVIIGLVQCPVFRSCNVLKRKKASTYGRHFYVIVKKKGNE